MICNPDAAATGELRHSPVAGVVRHIVNSTGNAGGYVDAVTCKKAGMPKLLAATLNTPEPFSSRTTPSLEGLTAIAPIVQHQFVQRTLEIIEVKLVTARPLSAAEERMLKEHLLARLPYPFELVFTYHEEILRSSSGKFEDFVSEVAE